MNNYVEPKVDETPFTCPHCGVLAQQGWVSADWNLVKAYTGYKHVIYAGFCCSCEKRTLWLDGNMVYPDIGNCPRPVLDMPQKVRELYLEAASIFLKSPRAAAALLRLALDVLCDELGAKGDKLNEKIGFIISQNAIDETTRKALDIIRYIGNEAAHNPGEINLEDNEAENVEFYRTLFEFINLVVDGLISRPKNTNAFFDALPQTIRDQITRRDKE